MSVPQSVATILREHVNFRLGPAGFAAADLRRHLAPLLGLGPDELRQGRLSYELRRLRLHGLIEREGASPRTVEWCRLILVRAVRRFGGTRPVDAIGLTLPGIGVWACLDRS